MLSKRCHLSLLAFILAGVTAGPAKAENIITDCGALIRSRVITNSSPVRISSITYVKLATTRIIVPGGQTRSIKALVTAETFCAGPGNVLDFCGIKVALNGAETMLPAGGNSKAMDSEDNTSSGHAYEWVKRVGEGTYVISLEIGVRDSRTVFEVDDMTFDVQQLF